MPEIQPTDQNNNKTVQHFIEFIMMQAQQAMLFLGKIPHPSTGETMVNLEAARMFIDYLEMLREKTHGNLSSDEEKVLNNILSELQMSFVQVSNNHPADKKDTSEVTLSSSDSPTTEVKEEEQKKRFSKSYGS